MHKKNDCSEFFDFVYSLNPLSISLSVETPPIPNVFPDGALYIDSLRPCYFNEMGAYIQAALSKASFFKTATA